MVQINAFISIIISVLDKKDVLSPIELKYPAKTLTLL
jgi:hypothetical protein